MANNTHVARGFGELVMAHRGKRICVMGGGPNLASDLERVEAEVWVSVNEHGAKHRDVDYVVAMDNTHTLLNVPMRGHLRRFTDAPIIGPWHWCDFQIMQWPEQPRFMLSGVVATWAASLMGAHPLILAGFDCYGGDGRTVRQHEDYRKHVIGDVRVCSGPLSKFYAAYDPSETFGEHVPPAVVDLGKYAAGDVIVRVCKQFEFRGIQWPVGSQLRVSQYECRLQIKHKSLEVVGYAKAEDPRPEAPAPKRRGRPPKTALLAA